MMGLSRAWRQWLRRPGAKLETFASLAGTVATVVAFIRFLGFVEARPGVVLPDPVLARLDPRDVSWLSFLVIYGAILVGLVLLARRPPRLVAAMQAYAVLIALRAATLALVPLEPPPGFIPLQDPLLSSASASVTKDLFFSGHTSTMFLLFLVWPHRRTRSLLLVGTGVVGGLMLVQHVHYALDVLAAPFFAEGAVKLAAVGRAGFGALKAAARAPAARSQSAA